ncbi:MAG: chorismate synthase, partial [Oscillospiraceae bacterium]|nr:chorismate synthase [Oscillospiraceae bacterium]
IGTHIKSCGGVKDRDFVELNSDIQAVNRKAFAKLNFDIQELNKKTFAVLDTTQAEIMQKKIAETAQKGDSIGGVLETAIINMPAGVGEPWFDTIEGVLAHALFSIPAIKGVQFGDAFDMVDNYGSQYNDIFRMQDNHVITETNHNAGINGGITNGMPILFRCAVKPTPSIYQAQKTINFFENQNADLQIKGRHDPAIIHRARIVVDSITALVLCDILSGRYGTDWLAQV